MNNRQPSRTSHPPWFPIINADKCDTCQQQYKCVTFCPHDVYEVHTHEVVIAKPLNCIYRYTSCANIYPQDAIIFPSITSSVKTIKKPLRARLY